MNYDDYARLFDKVFPLNEKTLDFLKKEFSGKTAILDLCCGRGLYTGALSKYYNVSGLDISPKMIAAAKEQFPDIKFSLGDMRCFEGTYQGIFVIGNSLVHLNSYDEIEKECKYLYDRLTENGKLVIQIINYDRIYKFGIDHLPEINKDDIRFIREYELHDESVVFNSTLIYNEMQMKQSVELYPLRSWQLVELLSSSGFKNIKLFDGFSEREFSPDSTMQLVVTAEK